MSEAIRAENLSVIYRPRGSKQLLRQYLQDRLTGRQAEGFYALSDADPEPDGSPATHLEISLTVDVDMPLSRLAAPVVTRTMKATMDATGDRFATNLLRRLGARER